MWYSSLVPSLLDPPLLVAKYGTKSWGGASLEYSVHSLRAEVGWLMRLPWLQLKQRCSIGEII